MENPKTTMAIHSDTVKQSDLLNQLVINRDNMEELGRVEVLWMYAPSHRVLGFICKSGFLGGKKKAFKLSQVSALGTNGIMTHSPPEDTDAEKVSQLESVIHCEVWSDSGQKIGKVTDYIFNLQTGEIAKYLFVSSNLDVLTGDVYQLFPSQVLGFGSSRVLVPEYVLKDLSVYREGIKQKLSKAGEYLKEEKEELTQELKSMTQRAQETTQQAKGRFFNLADQLKGRAQSLSQEAKEKLQNISEQLKEEAETLVDQVREKSHSITEQVEDGFQTLTVQAREILDSEEDDFDSPTSLNEEDPEDFFDALFREDEEPAPVVSPPQNFGQEKPRTAEQSNMAKAPSPAVSGKIPPPPPPTYPPPRSDKSEESVTKPVPPVSPQFVDDFDSLFDDVWDDPPETLSSSEPASEGTESSPAELPKPDDVKPSPPIAEDDEDDWL